jgi:hypothetical protein
LNVIVGECNSDLPTTDSGLSSPGVSTFSEPGRGAAEPSYPIFYQATGLIRASPGLQSGGAGFQTRENALSCNDRALALVRMPKLPNRLVRFS